MKILYELVDFCENFQDDVFALLPKGVDDPIRKLIQLLYYEKDLTNAEAMIRIYGMVDVKSFSILKARMKDVLIKAISIQNISSVSENIRYNRVIESMRQNLATKIMLYRGSRTLAMEILEKSITGSVEDEISFNVLEKIRILTLHYGTSNFNKYKLNKYLELEERYFELIKAETKAIHYFIELKKLQMRSFAEISESEKNKSKHYANDLDKINLSSRTFDFYKFQVFVKAYEFNYEYNELLSLCDTAELKFGSEKYYSLSSLIVIKQVRLYTLIQLGRYNECFETGLPELEKRELSAINWYSFVHYIIKAYLYSGEYNEAARLVAYCINHKNFKKLNRDLTEIANLHLGYIHLLAEAELFKPPFLKTVLPDFKLAKFINATPIFNKDKRGINVSILLMHIAFLLQRKDYNAIIDRTDSLNQYAYRYLRKDDSFRSNCMIKMVIQMTKADFNPIRTDRYTADLRKQLGHVTLAGSGENIEVEIIPFEILWDIMRKTL